MQVITVVDAVALLQIAAERPVVHLLGGAASQMHNVSVGREIGAFADAFHALRQYHLFGIQECSRVEAADSAEIRLPD